MLPGWDILQKKLTKFSKFNEKLVCWLPKVILLPFGPLVFGEINEIPTIIRVNFVMIVISVIVLTIYVFKNRGVKEFDDLVLV